MADEGGDAPPPDLRFTRHQRDNVEVHRDLSTEGHLARGDKTRMSKLSFTARARPRDQGERDPAFVDRSLEHAPAPEVPAVPAAPEPASTPAPSLLQRVARFMGGTGS